MSRKKNVDWSEVQRLYDAGTGTKSLGLNWNRIAEGKRLGLFKARPSTNALKGTVTVRLGGKRVRVNRSDRRPRVAWNKGLSNKTDARVARISKKLSETMRRQYASGERAVPPMSPDAARRLSTEQSVSNRGGRCKWFVVDGRRVQGTWERDIATALSRASISWSRPSSPWRYALDGRKSRYTPDFFVAEIDTFIEVKGFWWGRDREKMAAVRRAHESQRKLVVIDKSSFRTVVDAPDPLAVISAISLWNIPDVAPMVERDAENVGL